LPDWIAPGPDEFDLLARAIRSSAPPDHLRPQARDAGLEYARRTARSEKIGKESVASFKRSAFSLTIPILLVLATASLAYGIGFGTKSWQTPLLILLAAVGWYDWIHLRRLARGSTFKRSRVCLVCGYDLFGVPSAVEPELS